MKKSFKVLLPMVVILMLAFTACNNDSDESNGNPNNETVNSTQNTPQNNSNYQPEFDYSQGLDENGFWAGITALNYVDLFDIMNIVVPHDVHYIPAAAIQSEVDHILMFFAGSTHIFDRAVAHGDTIDIDFVGSVDGVEFAGGSTNGMGMEVTIGVTQFIDDFLYQLIGVMPGDTINVEVTFPDDYFEPSLAGLGALFITTVNFILEPGEVELNDEFVATNLAIFEGWTTVDEMWNGIENDMRRGPLQQFIGEMLINETTVSSVPQSIITYQKNSILEEYRMGAVDSGMELEHFIHMFMGIESIDELIAIHEDDIIEQATFFLIIQAVAEEAGIRITADDLEAYFLNFSGSSDYSMFEDLFGLPYLKKIILSQHVLEFLIDNVVFE